MSVANANAFALLDDEGTVDVNVLAAKLPVSKNEVVIKSEDTTKQQGEQFCVNRQKNDWKLMNE